MRRKNKLIGTRNGDRHRLQKFLDPEKYQEKELDRELAEIRAAGPKRAREAVILLEKSHTF